MCCFNILILPFRLEGKITQFSPYISTFYLFLLPFTPTHLFMNKVTLTSHFIKIHIFKKYTSLNTTQILTNQI